MQPSNRIYYSTVFIYLFIYLFIYEFSLRFDYGLSPHAYANQRVRIQLELLMMSGMPLETC